MPIDGNKTPVIRPPWTLDTLRTALADLEALTKRLGLGWHTNFAYDLADLASRLMDREQGYTDGGLWNIPRQLDHGDVSVRMTACFRIVEELLLGLTKNMEGEKHGG